MASAARQRDSNIDLLGDTQRIFKFNAGNAHPLITAVGATGNSEPSLMHTETLANIRKLKTSAVQQWLSRRRET